MSVCRTTLPIRFSTYALLFTVVILNFSSRFAAVKSSGWNFVCLILPQDPTLQMLQRCELLLSVRQNTNKVFLAESEMIFVEVGRRN